MSTSDRFVTVATAGALSGVTERTIRRWIGSGRLPVVSGPRGRLVDLDAVQQLAAGSGHDPTSDPDHGRTSDGQADDDRIRVRTDPEADRTGDPDLSAAAIAELGALIREKDQTILELAGRLGWLQAQLAERDAKIALLEAPAESSVNSIRAEDGQTAAAEMNHPAPVENGPRIASERERSAPDRPWWRRWLRWATQPV